MNQRMVAHKSQSAASTGFRIKVAPPDDMHEREADRVADEVMSGATPAWSLSGMNIAPPLQRKCSCGGSSPSGGECEDCKEKKTLQRKSTGPAAIDSAPPLVHEVLGTYGRPLDPAARNFFEPRFQQDFSRVRVHDDAKAAESARSVSASAYTVGGHVVFGEGQYSPASQEGRRLVAHELAHVVQQTRKATIPAKPSVQRKVILKKAEMSARERAAFLRTHRFKNPGVAAQIMEEMAAAGDAFDFATDNELKDEITKRLSTVHHMEESQETFGRIPGDKRSAFGYPFSHASALYGPRVNYAAREYWEPGTPDNYAVRTNRIKNKELMDKPRFERCQVYGDQCGEYGWKLSAKGKADPYHAIAYLFVPQPPNKRTLIHCDYLISLVNFMSLADSLGKTEFNKRIAAFGANKVVLRYDAFFDLHLVTYLRTSSGARATDAAGHILPMPGLRSTQRVRPSSEKDLVIGDHIVFFNHLAYDLINKRIGNAWRLENAVFVSRSHGKDVFLGHGSGYRTEDQMRQELAHEYNIVADKALAIVTRVKSKDKKTQAAAQAELTTKFPEVKQVGTEFHASGIPGLLSDSGCGHNVDQKLRRISASEVLGPKSPCNPATMNEVERPIESAK
ncbi:MAG: DUF4157 domain-containing protein [Acidobacteriaceae bacterium]